MFKNRGIYALILTGFLSLFSFNSVFAQNPVNANDFSGLQWLEKDEQFKEWCKQEPIISSKKIFPDTYLKAKSIRSDFCSKKLSDQGELQTRIVQLLNDLGRLFKGTNIQVKLLEQETTRIEESGELAIFLVSDDPVLVISLENFNKKIEEAALSECNLAVTSLNDAGDCYSALKEYKEIYNYAQGTLSQPYALAVVRHLEELEAKWSKFYDNSKSQTIWEMAINGALFQKSNREHEYLAPPNKQIIFMHPNVVVENVSNAIDGAQLKEALILEVLGLDWWKQEKWYIPSGGSVIALYSDRAVTEDWGYGVAVHFDSQFTFGAVDHDGDTGVFISIDLLKLLQDKGNLIKSYRGKIDF